MSLLLPLDSVPHFCEHKGCGLPIINKRKGRRIDPDTGERVAFVCARGHERWVAPVTMVASALFIGDQVLIGQRGTSPNKGGWVLPGGYVDPRETPRQAAPRELLQEMCIDTKGRPWRLIDEYVAPNLEHLALILCYGLQWDPSWGTPSFRPDGREMVKAELMPISDFGRLAWRSHRAFVPTCANEFGIAA